ncbi:MAG: CapA family protein [Armatimonadota bacterium]
MIKRTAGALIVALLSTALFGAGWFVGSSDEPLDVVAETALEQVRVICRAVGEGSARTSVLRPVEVTPTGTASVLLVGDLLPMQDREYLAHASELISSADFAVGNLECPLSMHGRPSPLKFDGEGRLIHNEFIFRAPPSQARRMADAGLDAVTLANNHIMDYGAQALMDTLAALDGAGISYTGAGRDRSQARKPMIFEVEGQVLSMLAYVSARTLPGTEYFEATDEMAGTVFVSGSGGGAPDELTRGMLRNDITEAAKASDFVIVAFHWGTEGNDAPDPLPRRLARWCIDSGADMVIGHHPHKLQGVEIYEGKPIAYSLGNFVFPTPWESNHFSAALELQVANGRWERLVLHPVKLRFREGDPVPAQGPDLQRIVNRVMRLSNQLGTASSWVDDESNPRIVIRNPAFPEPRAALLQREAEHFYSEPHPEIDGMSVAHFLAWDISGGERIPEKRTLVIKTSLASEVLEIFEEIYLSPEQFPIRDLVGYNYRTVAGGSGLSNHAFGRAIDINRAENPMIEDGKKIVHPDEPPYEPGEWRPGEDPYSITPDGPVVRAFKSRGWRWGGDWHSCKDYQHFDKPGA